MVIEPSKVEKEMLLKEKDPIGFIIEEARKRHGIEIEDNVHVRDLIRYVKNIGFNEGYKSRKELEKK